MGFETKTEIQTATGGEVKVRNIVKRPMFLPDDKLASNSYGHGGVCVTCGRMTDCPICDVEPGGDPDGNQQCLARWTLFTEGGSGSGPMPDYGGGAGRRMTITVSSDGSRLLSGGYGVRRTFTSQPMFWPKQNVGKPGPLTASCIKTGWSTIGLRFGQTKYHSTPMWINRKEWTNKVQFEGFGATVILTRYWNADRKQICVNSPSNPNVQWPYMDAWKKPCFWPPQNMDQWLFAVSRNDYPPDLRACYENVNRRHQLYCEKWGEKQVLIYHAAVSAEGLAKKIRCQEFAGIELGLVAQSDESWNGPYRRYKSVQDFTYDPEPGETRRRISAPYPLEYWKWEGAPPTVVIFPSVNEIHKPASPQASRGGMTGTGTVT
jgi:hypothetical protein